LGGSPLVRCWESPQNVRRVPSTAWCFFHDDMHGEAFFRVLYPADLGYPRSRPLGARPCRPTTGAAPAPATAKRSGARSRPGLPRGREFSSSTTRKCATRKIVVTLPFRIARGPGPPNRRNTPSSSGGATGDPALERRRACRLGGNSFSGGALRPVYWERRAVRPRYVTSAGRPLRRGRWITSAWYEARRFSAQLGRPPACPRGRWELAAANAGQPDTPWCRRPALRGTHANLDGRRGGNL